MKAHLISYVMVYSDSGYQSLMTFQSSIENLYLFQQIFVVYETKNSIGEVVMNIEQYLIYFILFAFY